MFAQVLTHKRQAARMKPSKPRAAPFDSAFVFSPFGDDCFVGLPQSGYRDSVQITLFHIKNNPTLPVMQSPGNCIDFSPAFFIFRFLFR